VAPQSIPSNDIELAELIINDYEILRQNIPGIKPFFAWHNPTRELISRGLDLIVPGLLNLYSSYFFMTVRYYSDSNMRYSVKEFQGFINDESNRVLHFLFHPFNWIVGGENMIEILAKTWKYIIREKEQEMLTNRTWSRFLDGIPSKVLDQFAGAVVEAAGSSVSGEKHE